MPGIGLLYFYRILQNIELYLMKKLKAKNEIFGMSGQHSTAFAEITDRERRSLWRIGERGIHSRV